MYDEEYFLEHALYPWLDDCSMDGEPEPLDDDRDPPYYCDCGCGLWGNEAECPDCGQQFPDDDVALADEAKRDIDRQRPHWLDE